MPDEVASHPASAVRIYARLLALSFLSGAAVMSAELAAPRLSAPHLGAGLLTWSSIFAVFLGAMAVGNAIGGRLADGGASSTLPKLFAIAGLAVVAAVPIEGFLREGAFVEFLPHALRSLIMIALTFGPGALAIGTIAPALGRAVLASSEHPGRALGAVSGAGALGSVFGTFITGFLLVPSVGTRIIYLGAGILLLACIPMARTIRLGGPRAARTEPLPLPRGWAGLAALAGFALLVLEVIAARVAANRLGTSVYTWTSVIGVVLVALGAGNWLGGRLADRFPARRLLGTLLLASSVTVAACLWTPALMTAAAAMDGPWMLRTLLAVAVAFTLPALAIGTLSPVVIRAALTDPEVDGRVVGRLYAIGTAGAVAGSLFTGYLLIPLLQVPLLITALALGLALAAWRLGGRGELPWIGTLVLVGLLASLPFDAVRTLGLRVGVREDAPDTYVEDSRYFHIGVEPHATRWVRLRETMDRRYVANDPLLRAQLSFDEPRRLMFWKGPMTPEQKGRLLDGVQELGNREAARELAERAGHRMRLLSLDRFVHGFIDLDDPLWLEYEYEILQGALIRALWPRKERVRCFFIGGGAYTFQRRLLRLYGDGVHLVTAEIDPAVTRVAREHLGLEDDARHEIVHDDARTALRSAHRDASAPHYDIVFGDAFHDLGVPWHLTTREFAQLVETRSNGGFYLVNMIDVFASGRFLGAFLETLESVFTHVRVLSMGPRDDHAQETFLLLASQRPLTWEALQDDTGRALDVVEYDAKDLEVLRRRAGDLVLTDDHAPVESLLAPVVRMRASGGLRGRR